MKPFYFEKSLGIDIRQGWVSLCLLGKKLKGIDIVGSHMFPLEVPMTVESGRQNFIDQTRQFLKDYGGIPENVAVSIPRNQVTIQTFSLPAPDRNTVDSMVTFELERQFATALEDLHVSYHVMEETPNQFQITAAGIRQTVADTYLELLGEVGIKPHVLDASTFANLNLLAPKSGKVSGVEAVLDLGPESIEIVILQDGVVALSRHLPLVVEDYRDAFFRSDLEASDYKQQAKPLSKKITDAIQTTLYSCKQLREDDSIERLHIFGGGDFAEPVCRQIEEDTGVLTQTALPVSFMTKDLPVDFDPALMNTSLGLALRELKETPYRLNLLPPELAPRKKKSNIRTTFALTFLAAFMIAGGFASQIAYNQSTLDSLNAQLKEVKSQVGSLEKVDQEFRELEKFANKLDQIDEKYPLKLSLIDELGKRLPKDTYLTRISLSQNKLEIQGFSASASNLIQAIEDSPMFQNTAFSGSVVNEKRGKKFTIRSEIGKPVS